MTIYIQLHIFVLFTDFYCEKYLKRQTRKNEKLQQAIQ